MELEDEPPMRPARRPSGRRRCGSVAAGMLILGAVWTSGAGGDVFPIESIAWAESEDDRESEEDDLPERLSAVWSDDEGGEAWIETAPNPYATMSGAWIASPEETEIPVLPEAGVSWLPDLADTADSGEPGQGRRSRGAGGGMMGMGAGGDKSPFRYRMTWQPAQSVQGQSAEMGLAQHDVAVAVPVWISGPHIVSLSGGVRLDQFQTTAVFPDSGRPFPEELWNIRAGANYLRRFDNGWTAGGNVTIGSASDRPFGDMRDVNFAMIAFLRVPRGERDAWNFTLAYSPLSQIPFPVPLVSYQWQPSEEFSMNLGLPLQMTYRPTEAWKFDISYMLLTTVHAQATYSFTEEWRAYAAFDWQNQSWFLDGGVNSKERIFSYEKRLSVGLQGTAWKHLAVDLSTGYLFDRFYFTGENYDDRTHDRLKIGDGLFASAQAGWAW